MARVVTSEARVLILTEAEVSALAALLSGLRDPEVVRAISKEHSLGLGFNHIDTISFLHDGLFVAADIEPNS